MACVKLCPTGALDPNLSIPEKAGMGRAVIDTSICYSHLFYDMDVLPDHTGKKIAAVCNTCYNVCPLQGIAIRLKHNLAPEILDGCVGCGICVERCPTRPRRAVEVYPTGMGRKDEAGFYHARRKRAVEGASTPPKKSGPLSIEETLERKEHLGGHDLQFNAPKNPKGTERPDE
jgi:ferredoxin-type protein NapG